MLKRHSPTPDEIRNRRIRRSWLASFSIVMLVFLLSAAWFGATAMRKVPPRMVVPTDPPMGEFVFQVQSFFDNPAGLLLEGSTSTGGTGKQPHEMLLRDALAPTGQVLYWRNPESDKEETLIYISLVRPRRIYLQRLESLLSSSEALAKSGTELNKEHIGYYVMDSRGLFIYTSEQLQTFGIVEAPRGSKPWEAKYHSDIGYVPNRFQKELGKNLDDIFPGTPLDIVWRVEGQEKAVKISYLPQPGSEPKEKLIDYFDPITSETAP